MARSISFVVDREVDTRITISELSDGCLRFDLEVLGSGLIADLRGLFTDLLGFDVDAPGNALNFEQVSGEPDLITGQEIGEEAVDRVQGDVNINGDVANALGKSDLGIAFGTSGIGSDDIQAASFKLSGPAALTLDALDLADIALRYTSVGEDGGKRSESLKIAAQTSGVARNDAFTVKENDSGNVDLLANDTNGELADGTRKTVISVVDADGALVDTGTSFQRTVVRDGLVLGTLIVTYDGFASFVADGADVDKLAHDDAPTLTFTYETESIEGNLATADGSLTVDGVNDQPVAQNVSVTVTEDDGFVPEGLSNSQSAQNGKVNDQFDVLSGNGVTRSFVASDIDIGDVLSYQIISAPTDAAGNQYGAVTNNGDGTFTFNPVDNFQFLDAGESRDVTFQYVAIDDSGVGTSPTPPEETDTSDPKTVTVTVTGIDDADISLSDRLLFQTENQSIWNTGGAFMLEPDIPFLGFDFTQDLDATLWNGITIDSGAVLDVLNGLVDAGEIVVETACEIFTLGFGDCSVDFGEVDSINIPGVSTAGDLAAKIGLQPYFFLNAGDVDAEVPVDVYFTVPRQVEEGDAITIGSAFSVDNGATFQTEGPEIQFGLDFVLDVVADLTLNALGSSIELFDFDTADFLGTGELGETGFNIFDVGPGSTTELDLAGFGTLDLTVPDFGATGTPANPPTNTTLEGEDEEEFVDLTIDVDSLVSAIPGVPPFGGGDSFSISQSFGELGTVNIATFEYAWDLLSVELQGILSAVQDFSMSITDLPLLARLEDGFTEITGFSLGEEIVFDVPVGSDFDVDLDGDMDGLMDFDIAVDMEALFDHESSLELDMNLILGLLRLTADFTSDFAPNQDFSLFDGIIPSLPFDPDPNDEFLIGGTIPLIEDATLATLFDDEFPLEGWNTPTTDADLVFDVA